MRLEELVEQVATFDGDTPKERIKLLGWWLHIHGEKERFTPSDIRGCFDRLHVDEPPALATYIARMEGKELLKEKGSYKLARNVRAELDKKYGVHHSVVAVNKLLTELPDKIPSTAERAFLQEALKCYRIEAYRACIVMTWNLAYSHLLDWLLSEPARMQAFNAAIGRRFPKLNTLQVNTYDEFLDELKESQVLDICSTAGLVNSNVYKILKEKLGKRNMAAHPASVVVVQSQADDVITDRINNVVLTLT